MKFVILPPMEDKPPSQSISTRHHNTALQFLGFYTTTKFVGHNPKVGDARNPLFTTSITHVLFSSQINIIYIFKKCS
jgi:hypothetical protein